MFEPWTMCSSTTHPLGCIRELHLAGHITAPLENEGNVKLLRSSPSERRAVLLVDRMAGWYANLAQAGSALPNLGGRSWHVEVVWRPVGWLGTYRRSRTTGLWFSGGHRYHVQGN